MNKSGQEYLMNPNYRMVPECEYWVTYELDTSREILTRNRVIEDGVGQVF